MPDSVETQNGLNPNNLVDASEDADNDGLTNLEEYRLGTNMRNPDTNGDGVSDRLGAESAVARSCDYSRDEWLAGVVRR